MFYTNFIAALLLSVVVTLIVHTKQQERKVAYSFGLSVWGYSDEINDIAHNYGEGFYVAGTNGLDSKLHFNKTNIHSPADMGDGFLAKYSSNGDFRWAVDVISTSLDHTKAVSATLDAVYIAGKTATNAQVFPNTAQGSAFLAKYSPDGELIWGKQFSTRDATSVAANDNFVYVGGTSSAAFTVDGINIPYVLQTDCYLIKFSKDGDAIWGNGIGSSGYDSLYQLAVTGDGGVLAVAYSQQGTISIGGKSIQDLCFVVKYSSSGVVEWATGIPNTAYSNCKIAPDDNGNTYVSAVTNSKDSTLVKLSHDGTIVWTKTVTCTSSTQARDVSYSAKGTIFMIGALFSGTITFNGVSVTRNSASMYLVEYSPEGQELWFTTIQGSSGSVVSAYDNDIYLAGTFSAAQFDNFQVNKGGTADDIFIAKYSKDLVDCTSQDYMNTDECIMKAACVVNEQCTCISGYSGHYCSMNRTCDSVLFDDEAVCSGNGTCVDQDQCQCNQYRTGDDCSTEIACYGTQYKHSSVCSGRGVCVGIDVCKCDNGFAGFNCQRNCNHCYSNY